MKKPIMSILFIVLFYIFALGAGPSATEADVVILHSSNVYGNVVPYNYFTESFEAKGLIPIYSYVQELKSNNENLVLIDTGNLTYGSPFGDYYIDKPDNPVMTLFNQIGYDVFVPGTFELSLEQDRLENLIGKFKGYTLAGNLKGLNTKVYTYYTKVLPNGLKVATIGVTPNYGKMTFDDQVKVIKEKLTKLKEQVKPDVIVLATSGGITNDPITGKKLALESDLNIGDRLVKEFAKDVDVFLFGNEAIVYTRTNNNKAYSIPGADGSSINEINIKLNKVSNKWAIKDISIKNVDMASVEVSQPILSWAEQYEAPVENWLNERVLDSTITVGFHKYMAILEDNLITEIVNKSIIDYTKASAGIWNVFNPNYSGLAEGIVTRKDIYKMVGKTTTVKLVQMTGMDIRNLVASYSKYIKFSDSRIVFSSLLSKEPWIIDLFENIQYENVINDGTIRRLDFAGKPISDSDQFFVSLPSLRTYGDNPIFAGKVVKDFEVPVANILLENIKTIVGGETINLQEDMNRSVYIGLQYTVQPGDTFRQIAYRLAVSEDELLKLNPVIKDVNLIRPGWKLNYYKRYLDLIPPLKELFEYED
ncbi:MAG TPA: LysM peptidoglycan-binding domain-containing protein [Fervidobacterium sp.]|nr:LysM peptidoglycan-binding domain-containing protein [Fervidobacterium sp.]HQQ17314.1 LysM peptidoglycan-binding domain-containing protein [Fervidobacterium sp.]